MKADHDALVELLPAGSPERRLEAYLSMEAVIRYGRNRPRSGKWITVNDALTISVVSRMPLLAIRTAIERLLRAIHAHPSRSEAA